MVASGIASMLASGGGRALVTLGHRLMGLGSIFLAQGSIRTFQASKAGRAHRGSRPFAS
jgi:hypothetical protein